MSTMTGGCACGRVRFSADVESDAAYLCHCRMCQRATGSVSIAFTEIEIEKARWLGEPDWYDSSSIARRPFCARCGTSLGFVFKDPSRGRMDLTVASFDDPSRFRPAAHAGAESLHEVWLETSALPRHPTSAASEAATRRDRGEIADAG